MTTEIRAVPVRTRVGEHASNFHEPAALNAYGRYFQRIGIASVAAAAAQVKPGQSKDKDTNGPVVLRWEDDAA